MTPDRTEQERAELALSIFDDLFSGPNFHVQIGGNPILVERMLDRIDEARLAGDHHAE